jgi:hypothetical protein
LKDKYIITQKVLNEETGELITQDLKLLEEKSRNRIKGGFKMSYAEFDNVQMKIISSNNDVKIFYAIKDLFTYKKEEVCLNKDIKEIISRDSKCSVRAVERMIKKMTNEKLLGKVSRGVYRLNPFMYLPYRADGAELQKEWRELFDETMEDVIKDIKSNN